MSHASQQHARWCALASRCTRRSKLAFTCVGLACFPCRSASQLQNRLVGLVVKASASGAEDPGFESRLRQDFSGSSHTSDLKMGTPVATLPGAWHYRASAGIGRPGVSIL